MVGKRLRDIVTPDTQLIEVYEDLANESEEVRLKAARVLLTRFAPPSCTSHQQIRSITVRLFRGLCSSRKAARIGFSVAVTEFLTQIFQPPIKETILSLEDVLNVLEKFTVAEGSTSGQVSRASFLDY
jgi:DNA polymerase phi